MRGKGEEQVKKARRRPFHADAENRGSWPQRGTGGPEKQKRSTGSRQWRAEGGRK